MNYISFIFLAFLICLLAVYILTPNRFKWTVLLLFSLIFYVYSGVDKLLFMLGTSLVVYFSALRMQKIWREYDGILEREKGKISSTEKKQLRQKYTSKSKHVLLFALIICLGILCWCKVGIQAVALCNRLAGSSFAMKIIVPLGVSYYTFSAVGYLVDVHWQTVEAERNYHKLLLCMIYFPHVVEGPIPRYERILPQLDKLTSPDYDRFCKGAQLALWGLFKKLVIADRLGIFINHVFNSLDKSGGFVIPVTLVFAAFQMYADFSGCMDIVTGISDIIGIKLDKNFDHPFLSRSVSEFWRRWHISLFNWLKDYIYMPLLTSSLLGKFRKKIKGKFSEKTVKAIVSILPTACVFVIIGMWHSVGMQYFLHGLYWTFLFALTALLEDKLAALSERFHINTESNGWHCFQIIRTFALYAASYLIFTPNTLQDSILAFKKMVTDINPWIFWDGTFYSYGLDRRNFWLAVWSIVFLMIVDVVQEKHNIRDMIGRRNIVIRWTIYMAGIFAVLIFGIYGPGYDATSFIYQLF